MALLKDVPVTEICEAATLDVCSRFLKKHYLPVPLDVAVGMPVVSSVLDLALKLPPFSMGTGRESPEVVAPIRTVLQEVTHLVR